jgi:8-oxo-dGTP pyrophosphatase MutT (NUDIX family)
MNPHEGADGIGHEPSYGRLLTQVTLQRSSAPDIEIGTLDRAEIKFEPWPWPFAAERRGEIDSYFDELKRLRAGVWNGRVLLLKSCKIETRVLHGTCFETDYASFCAWRAFARDGNGIVEDGIINVFADAAMVTADGAYLAGEMAPDTAAAGKIYFPSGTPEPDDLDDSGLLDLEGNVRRELREETGIDAGELAPQPGFTFVRDGASLALVKTLRSRQNARELHDRIMKHIESEERPELVDIRILRSAADFEPAMPRYITAFLTHCWSRETT